MQPLDRTILQRNMKKQTYLRAVVAFVGGSSAGYLGLEGIEGLYYWIGCAIVAVLLDMIKMRGQQKQLFNDENSLLMVMVSQFVSTVASLGLTFVLFWTFFYNIVHVYQ